MLHIRLRVQPVSKSPLAALTETTLIKPTQSYSLYLEAKLQSESVNLQKWHKSKRDERLVEKLISVGNGEGTACLSPLSQDFITVH